METPTPAAAAGAPTGQRGVLIVDTGGRTLFASGIAEQPDLARHALTYWRQAQRSGRTLFALDEPDVQPTVAIVLTAPEATALLLMQRAGQDDAREPLFEFAATVDLAGDILAHFLSNPFEALTVADREGIIRYMSPVHERFFGLKAGGGIGRHATDVIENSKLHLVAASGKADIGELQEMRGITRVVSRHPIRNSRGAVVGAIGQIMFKGPEQLQALSSELSKLRSEVAFYRRELNDLRNRSYGLDQMVGSSLAMQRLKQQIVKVAPLDVPVLLTGESGTGKELAAHAIHKLSLRRDAPVVMVNAAALPATLVESELFGYESGSFTGAERKGRKGKIEQADSGTLFFDEVGDMPADMQVKLLRVLQDGSFQRVGGSDTRRSDFRLISASNRNFEAMIADGSFRLDLFYRIGGVTIRMPTLRERIDDLPMLAELALEQFATRHGHVPKRLSAQAIDWLSSQNWPGNVRQLMHTVERAAIFADGDEIGPQDFGPGEVSPGPATNASASASEPDLAAALVQAAGGEPLRVGQAVEQVEEQMIRQAMVRFHGNKKRAAAELGISRSYLYKRLARLGLSTDGDE